MFFFENCCEHNYILCVLVPLKKKLIQSWQKMGMIWGISTARPVGWDGKRGLAGNSVLLGQRTVEEICVQQLGVQKMSGQGHGFFMIGSTWWIMMHLYFPAKQMYQTAEWSAVALMVHKRLEEPTQNNIFFIFFPRQLVRNISQPGFSGFHRIWCQQTWSQPLKPRRRSHPWDGSRQHHLTLGPKGYWGNAKFSRLAAMLLALS